MNMSALFDLELLAAFLTLASLEIVLGIDNIIFLSITAGKLPAHQQARARTLGLAGAMITRILLLLSLAWLAELTDSPWRRTLDTRFQCGAPVRAPRIGEHTDEVLASVLGLSEAAIGRLLVRELRAAPDYPAGDLQALNRRYTRLLTDLLREGIEAGEIAPGLDLGLARDLFFGGIEHAGLGGMGAGRAAGPDKIDRFFALFWTAIGGRRA